MPSPVSSPGFRAMKVAVAAARMVGPRVAPVSASSPLGTSSARIGMPRIVRAPDQRCVVRGERPREADAEQSVDDERSAPSRRNVGHGRAAGTGEGAIGVARVRRQLVGVAAKDGTPRRRTPRAGDGRRRKRRRRCCRVPRERAPTRRVRPPCVGRRRWPPVPHAPSAAAPGRGLHAAQLVGTEDRKKSHAGHYRTTVWGTGSCRQREHSA